MPRKRKPYDLAPFDTKVCAWCTNTWTRTKLQADRGTRYCSRKCAAFGRAVVMTDDDYRRMARLSHQSRVAGRLEGLAASVEGLTAEQAYLKGYRTGYSAGKYRRRATVQTDGDTKAPWRRKAAA